MGSVFLAEHMAIQRQLALKLLHPSLAQIPEIARRFEREAIAIGRIEHPNCVDVSDFGRLEDGSLFLVMEYLEGRSLGEIIEEEGRIAPGRALYITRHLLRGLRHAHGKGIVHRDVKPDNITIVTKDGDENFAKLLDFGIAKLIDGSDEQTPDQRLTQAGIAFGTPIYLSPEQALGQTAEPRSDLYSATVVLFEMLAGQPPFAAEDNQELLAMHAGRPAPTLSSRLPQSTVPAEIEAIVARGLAKRPEDRFENARAFIEAIDAVLGEGPATPAPEPIHASLRSSAPTEPPPHAATTGRSLPALFRQPLALVVIAVLCGLAATGVVWAIAKGDGAKADRSAVEIAEDRLAGGSPERSLELLKEDPDELKKNSLAQLQLGHTEAARSKYGNALVAYENAIHLNTVHGVDETMRTNLELMIDDKGDIYPAALKLLYQYSRDPADKARLQSRLVELTLHPTSARIRERSVEIADELGLGEGVDRLKSFALDLRESRTCAQRKGAVAKLRALGDPRAIPLLEKAKRRMVGRKRKKRNLNACLVQAADDAIRSLRSGSAAGTAGAPTTERPR